MIVLFRAVVRVRVLQARARLWMFAARVALTIYVRTTWGDAWLRRYRDWIRQATRLADAAQREIPR